MSDAVEYNVEQPPIQTVEELIDHYVHNGFFPKGTDIYGQPELLTNMGDINQIEVNLRKENIITDKTPPDERYQTIMGAYNKQKADRLAAEAKSARSRQIMSDPELQSLLGKLADRTAPLNPEPYPEPPIIENAPAPASPDIKPEVAAAAATPLRMILEDIGTETAGQSRAVIPLHRDNIAKVEFMAHLYPNENSPEVVNQRVTEWQTALPLLTIADIQNVALKWAELIPDLKIKDIDTVRNSIIQWKSLYASQQPSDHPDRATALNEVHELLNRIKALKLTNPQLSLDQIYKQELAKKVSSTA